MKGSLPPGRGPGKHRPTIPRLAFTPAQAGGEVIERPIQSCLRFSFLLSAPLIFGAGLHKFKEFSHNVSDPTLFIGIAVSAASGLLAIYFLMNYVRTTTFTPFVIYRLLLSAGIVAWLLSGHV